MAGFRKVNEMYVQHITEKDSVRGVPSRCCVELPLRQADMGSVAVEILAVRDQSKKVLHVQSISCWAPSCIGPYSQATQHRQLIYMAGQIGLDPPTMSLVLGGAPCEMVQALKNCQAVAEVFTPIFVNSVLSFIVYCSSAATKKDVQDVGEVLESFLSRHKRGWTNSQSELPAPLILYTLVPALPKGALVEIAPLIHVSGLSTKNYVNSDDESGPSWQPISLLSYISGTSGVQECWSCKGMILPNLLCRAITLFSLCPESIREGNVSGISFIEKIALGQAFQLLSSVLVKASLGWADVFVFHVYFVVDKIVADDLRKAVVIALKNIALPSVPLPTLIPVLGVGATTELQDVIAVELTASGGCQS